MKEGNTKGWGVEGVVYEEGVRGGYTWMEDDKQEVRREGKTAGGEGEEEETKGTRLTPHQPPTPAAVPGTK